MKHHVATSRALAVTMLLLLAATLNTTAQQPPSKARAPEYDVAILKNVMVPARDGVKLATDVYLPAVDGAVAPGKFPVLLTRTPYGKNGSEASATFLARRGYAVVAQDVRGRYDSGGTFYIYLDEGKDGYDAVEWAAKQPWSNGSVATFGGSYLAATQSALAVERPPSLKAMWVVVGTSNYHEDGAGRGGASYLLHNLAYGFSLASTSKEAIADPALRVNLEQGRANLSQWLRSYPFGKNGSPLLGAPAYQRWFQDWVDHADHDDYWKQNGFSFEDKFDRYPDIPIYFVGGWYDIFLRGTLTSFQRLSSMHKSQTRMMVGPWVHGVGPHHSGDVDFGALAGVNIQDEMLRWFDALLRGRDDGVLREPAVRYFTMGGGDGSRALDGHMIHGGSWKTAVTWPAPGAAPTEYYLHPSGRLSQEPPPPDARPSIFSYDPRKPVPTVGGQIDSGKELAPNGPFDQRCSPRVFGCTDDLPLSARPDVLVFQTEPLAEAVEVTGPMTVKLWVSSSARDTDFTAKLVDVHPANADYPHGYAMNIADRIVRVRYSKSLERAELLKPGEVREVEIDLLGTSNRFAKGHRIRLDISSSNFPFFDVNPNTGERLGYHTQFVTATNTVFHDRTRASRIVLPLVSGAVKVAEQ